MSVFGNEEIIPINDLLSGGNKTVDYYINAEDKGINMFTIKWSLRYADIEFIFLDLGEYVFSSTFTYDL